MDQKIKAPLPLLILILVGLIWACFAAVVSFSLSLIAVSIGGHLSFMAILSLVQLILLFAALIGLGRMKKWAFYTFVIVTIIDILLLTARMNSLFQFEAVLYVLFLAYLMSLRKRFV